MLEPVLVLVPELLVLVLVLVLMLMLVLVPVLVMVVLSVRAKTGSQHQSPRNRECLHPARLSSAQVKGLKPPSGPQRTY